MSLLTIWLLVNHITQSAKAGLVNHQSEKNLQTMAMHSPSQGVNVTSAIGGPTINIIGDVAVVPPQSPGVGESADFNGDAHNDKQTSIYVVREGDTLGEVAGMFDVSVDTIKWANNIDNTINPGDVLVILPVSGVRHEVDDGDTLGSIAERYGSSVEEIREYNELEESDQLAIGAIIDVPGGEMPQEAQPSSSSRASTQVVGGAISPTDTTTVDSGYFINPVPGSVVTQRLHGYNAVDFATANGSSVLAAADGRVVTSVGSGWNGGYGKFIVIEHDNGTRTLYSHLSGVIVAHGSRVVQGQVIGYQGSTGRSTGSHLHFEVRGATNPFSSCGLRTRCGS